MGAYLGEEALHINGDGRRNIIRKLAAVEVGLKGIISRAPDSPRLDA